MQAVPRIANTPLASLPPTRAPRLTPTPSGFQSALTAAPLPARVPPLPQPSLLAALQHELAEVGRSRPFHPGLRTRTRVHVWAYAFRWQSSVSPDEMRSSLRAFIFAF
jgi:hypothetical protein